MLNLAEEKAKKKAEQEAAAVQAAAARSAALSLGTDLMSIPSLTAPVTAVSFAPGSSYLKKKKELETISASATSGNAVGNTNTTDSIRVTDTPLHTIDPSTKVNNNTATETESEEEDDPSFFDTDVDSWGGGPILM